MSQPENIFTLWMHRQLKLTEMINETIITDTASETFARANYDFEQAMDAECSQYKSGEVYLTHRKKMAEDNLSEDNLKTIAALMKD